MNRKLLFLGAVAICSFANADDVKPNVLWILTDDHRYDSVRSFNKALHGREMSSLGYVESPNIDRLASMGTSFVNTYCQAMGCAPSRASMHYGRYPFRSGVYEFEYHNDKADHWKPHLPQRMEELGYQTVHVGKLGVRLRAIENGKLGEPEMYQKDFSSKMLASQGLTEWNKIPFTKELEGIKFKKPLTQVEFLKEDDGTIHYISRDLENLYPEKFKGTAKKANEKFDILRKTSPGKPADDFTPGLLGGVSPRAAGKTRDGYYTSVFKDYLNAENTSFKIGELDAEGVDTSKPLFCHIGYDVPHTPVLPPADYRARFQKKSYEIPELTDAEWKTMPLQLQKAVKASYSQDFTDEAKLQMVQDYYAFCAYGDNLIGQSADAFIKYSEKQNQPWMIVFVCGDHGWRLNDHGGYSKFTTWDVDSHNPIIVVSSDKKAYPAGKVVYDFTEFVDIAPTILAAAGVDLDAKENEYLDGVDMSEVVNKTIPARDYVIGESHAVTGPRAYIRTKEFVFSMQTRPHKKRGEDLDWARSATYEELDPALYHFTKDPGETNNLAHNKEYSEIAQAMKDKLINIVLGDNRVEVDWGKGMRVMGTTPIRSNFAPGSDDKKLKL